MVALGFSAGGLSLWPPASIGYDCKIPLEWFESIHVNGQYPTVMGSKTNHPLPVLRAADPSIVQWSRMDEVAINCRYRCRRNLFHHKPGGLRLGDHSLEFGDEVWMAGFISIRPDDVNKLAEWLAWWPANHPTEHSSRWMKAPDIASPQHIRAAHDAEPLILKGAVE